jgi:hypothetical protein
MSKLIQIQLTPFKDGVPRNSWRFWFKCSHLRILKIYVAQGLIIDSSKSFHQNLQTSYIQHKYDHY